MTRATADTSVPPARASRLGWLDDLRVALIVLVVLHHLALMYGAAGPWYWVETDADAGVTTVALVFLLLNQSWFMGLFFAISGYLTPGSFDRRGAGAFTRERVSRLGIPLLLFVLALAPLAATIGALGSGAPPPGYLEAIGSGPAWFLGVLLLLTLGYVLLRLARPPAPAGRRRLRARAVVGFVIGLAAATYLWRFVVPFGTFIPVVDLSSAFEAPQYVALFAAGAVAYRRGWLERISARMGVGAGIAVVVATVLLLPVIALHPQQMTGGGTWQSAVLALWEAITATGMPLALVVVFRRFARGRGRLARELSASAFGVFLVHAPVITAVAVLLDPLGMPPVPGFAVGAAVSLPLSFLVAAGLRRLPGLHRVL